MTDTNYYPPPAFSFAVAIAGSSSQGRTAIDAAFQTVSGVDPKVEIEEVQEGGVNSYVHQLPGVTKHANLVLKRGYVTQSSKLAQWAEQAVGSTLGGAIQTQVLIVSLLGPSGQPLVTWTFDNAWPVKWEVGQLDSKSNDILTETLEVAYTMATRQLAQGSGSAS